MVLALVTLCHEGGLGLGLRVEGFVLLGVL